MKFRFKSPDAAGPVRDTWAEAAQDGVDAHLAEWVDVEGKQKHMVRLADGCSVEEVPDEK